MNSKQENIAFTHNRGYWQALDDLLHWINTLEDLSVRKTDLYRKIMEMRPESVESILGKHRDSRN